MAEVIHGILSYLQAAWALPAPLGSADIHWSADWYNPRYDGMPQVSVTDLTSRRRQAFRTGGSIDYFYEPQYVVNAWMQIPVGAVGTAESIRIGSVRWHVVKRFREDEAVNWGGSLAPLHIVLPRDAGVPRHELDQTPRMLRYEITLVTTQWDEPM